MNTLARTYALISLVMSACWTTTLALLLHRYPLARLALPAFALFVFCFMFMILCLCHASAGYNPE